MRKRGLLSALIVFAAMPAFADVIVPGPPVVPISLTRAEIARMTKASRAAVASIFDPASFKAQPYLSEVMRAASAREIVRINEIVAVSVVGRRTFVLVITDKWLRPQTIGPVYTYLQCEFDEDGKVKAITIID